MNPREEERFNREGGTIEKRVIDFYSDLENPTFLSEEDLKLGRYRVPI